MIASLEDLYHAVEPAYDTPESLYIAVYKATKCGAWIEVRDNGVKVGSIVEGADECDETQELTYPFKIEDFWKALETVEHAVI